MAGPNDFTNQNIEDTYQRVLQISSSDEVTDGTGSLAPTLQVTSSNALLAITASHALTTITASHALFAVSASHETTFELSSSHAVNADSAISSSHTPNALTTMGTGTGNTVTVTQFDGTTFTRTINNVSNATNATNADCSDKVKTITCAADAERFITFVDDDNDPTACETVKTNPALRWNCRRRTLIVDGAIKSKGSDVTIISGSISMSGDLVITGSISSSTVGTSLVFTTGSFNHIITDGDTIEFRNAGTKAVEGNLVFDPTNGLTVKTADKSADSNIKIANVTAGETLIVGGSSDFQGQISASGDIFIESHSAQGAGKGFIQALSYMSVTDATKGLVLGSTKEDTYYQGKDVHAYLGGKVHIGDNPNTFSSHGDGDLGVQGKLSTVGNIYSAGNISASGTDHILGGDTLIHGGDLTIGQSGVISSGGGHAKLRLNNQGVGYEDIILFDKGNTNKWIMGAQASTDYFMIAKGDDTLTGTDPVFSLGISGDITASRNISASGTIIADKFVMNTNTNGIDFMASNGTLFTNILTNSVDDFIVQNLKNGENLRLRAGQSGNKGKVLIQQGGTATSIAEFGPTNSIHLSGSVTASENISGSSTTTASLARVESTSNKTGNITTAGSEIESTENLSLTATADIRMNAQGNDIIFSDGATSYITYNVETNPSETIVGDFTSDVSGDYKIDADGGNIQFFDDGSQKVDFDMVNSKVDFTTKVQTIGVDNGSGLGSLYFDTPNGTFMYGNSISYSNALLGGGQGDSTYVGFSGNELRPTGEIAVSYASGSITNNTSGTIQVTHSWPIPPGVQITGVVLIVSAAVTYRLESPSVPPFCGTLDLVKTGLNGRPCPTKVGYKALGLTVLSSSESAKLAGRDGVGFRSVMTADLPAGTTIYGLAYSYGFIS